LPTPPACGEPFPAPPGDPFITIRSPGAAPLFHRGPRGAILVGVGIPPTVRISCIVTAVAADATARTTPDPTEAAGLITAGGHGDHRPLGPRRRRRHGLRAHERGRACRGVLAGGCAGGGPGLLPPQV